MTPEQLDALDPGIRLTVRWLRKQGFETTDSGDGVSKKDAIAEGEALDYPHVFMRCISGLTAVFDAERLGYLLRKRGLELSAGMIEASYDPVDAVAVLALVGVNDDAFARSFVHVFGAPQKDALEPDERICQDAEAKIARVIFHVGATQTAQGWLCVHCWYGTHDWPGSPAKETRGT